MHGRQTSAALGRALELALFGDPFMRLGRALDPVLLFVTIGGKQPHDLIDAVPIAAAEQASDDVNIVANAKLVRHESLRTDHNNFGALNGPESFDEGLVRKH